MLIIRQIYYFIKLTINTYFTYVICIIAFVMMNIVIITFHL